MKKTVFNQTKFWGKPKVFSRILLALLFITLPGLIILSCDQDSLFYSISIEPPLKFPYVEGTPTKMAHIGATLYVASVNKGKIYHFSPSGWGSMPSPGGHPVMDLAVANGILYVLVMTDQKNLGSMALYKSNGTLISGGSGYSIQTIYGTDTQLFVGGMRMSGTGIANEAAIFYHNPTGSNTLEPIQSGVSLLVGAASNSNGTFLATASHGIFKTDTSNPPGLNPVSDTSGTILKGIISTGASIVAVSADGSIYESTNGTTFDQYSSQGVNFTGGMCVWNSGSTPSLLLLGIQHSASNAVIGYREIELDSSGNLLTKYVEMPGVRTPSTLSTGGDPQAKFKAALGKYPVLALYHVPSGIDSSKPVFASTSRRGLWSLRDGEWNAEEN
jgi:hypothetical protein